MLKAAAIRRPHFHCVINFRFLSYFFIMTITLAKEPNVVEYYGKYLKHVSLELVPGKDDAIHKKIKDIEIKKLYIPDRNGFCGYRCMVFGMFQDDRIFADELGMNLRQLLYQFLLENSLRLVTVLTNYNETEYALKCLPNLSDDWTFTFPDCLVLASIYYGKSCLYIDDEHTVPILISIRNQPPECILRLVTKSFGQQKRGFFNMYTIKSLPPIFSYDTHPLQVAIDNAVDSVKRKS